MDFIDALRLPVRAGLAAGLAVGVSIMFSLGSPLYAVVSAVIVTDVDAAARAAADGWHGHRCVGGVSRHLARAAGRPRRHGGRAASDVRVPAAAATRGRQGGWLRQRHHHPELLHEPVGARAGPPGRDGRRHPRCVCRERGAGVVPQRRGPAQGTVMDFEARDPVLDTVDRVCELCFGLFMALTFVGAVSATTAKPDAGRLMFFTALGCNVAWGLADAVMYLVRTLTNRTRRLALARAIRAEPEPARSVGLLRSELTGVMRTLVQDTELEAVRARMAAVPGLRMKPHLHAGAYLPAAAACGLVVL